MQDANNNTTTYVYDNDNRRTKVIYPDSNSDATGYDALGRVTSRTDAKGLTTQYGYDPLGRLVNVTDALNQVTSYGYDEVGNRISQTDANSHVTTYAYDQRGRRVARVLPLGQSEAYTYDPAGNLSTRTDFNGHTTTYTYDSVNHLLSKTADPYFVQNHLGAAAVSYSYNIYGQKATMTDATGTTYYYYNSLGQTQEVGQPTGILGYSYDLNNNVTSISSGDHVNYTYDALNRLASAQPVINGTPLSANTYSYDNVGNLQAVTYANGVVHSYTYDTRNRLTNLGVNGSGSGSPGAIASYAYTLDASGHRTGVTELSGRAVSYSYDNLYRLTNETIASDPHAVNGAASYVYDAVGNRTQKTSTLAGFPGGLTNYNANDQIATDTYDANGNTTQSLGTGCLYDFENHLVQAGAGISYVYDGDGNRVRKTANGVTTTYIVDTLNPTGYAQVLFESYTGVSGVSYEISHAYGAGYWKLKCCWKNGNTSAMTRPSAPQ